LLLLVLLLSRLVPSYFLLTCVLFNPGETINIYGRADKTQGTLTAGSLELSISEMFSPSVHPITNGEYDINITIPNDAKAGEYNILATATEQDSHGAVLNEGITTSLIKVRQVLKSLEVALDTQSIVPGNDLTYKVLAYDQANSLIYSDIFATLYLPDETEQTQKLLRTDETTTQHFEKNAAPGNWKITATLDEFEESREFLVENLKEVSFTLNPDQTLTVTNIGNIPFSGPIEVSFGEISKVKEIKELPVGESKIFRLEAPDGNYDVTAGTGETKQELGTTFLTGNAISVEDVGRTLKENMMVLIWIIVILIIAIIGLVLYRKISKRGSLGKPPSESKEKSSEKEGSKPTENMPVSHVVDKGEKQESSIISVKIKNAGVLANNHEALKAIDSALWKAKESKAKIYAEGDHRVIVFAPALTKEKDNTIKSLQTSQTIERMFNEYNKRHDPKIEFGIGAHIGNLIVEKKEGKFKFISVNNTITGAKRLAQHANNEVLISESIHRPTIGKVKTQKLQNQNYWKLLKVTDRSQHAAYIRNFTEHQKHNAPTKKLSKS